MVFTETPPGDEVLQSHKQSKHSLIGSAAASESLLLRVQAGISQIQGN